MTFDIDLHTGGGPIWPSHRLWRDNPEQRAYNESCSPNNQHEGGVAEVAGVAACVEVVGWLLEEHELQSSSAIEGLLGAAVVMGLEGVGGGVECRVGGRTRIVPVLSPACKLRRLPRSRLASSEMRREFQAFPTAVV